MKSIKAYISDPSESQRCTIETVEGSLQHSQYSQYWPFPVISPSVRPTEYSCGFPVSLNAGFQKKTLDFVTSCRPVSHGEDSQVFSCKHQAPRRIQPGSARLNLPTIPSFILCHLIFFPQIIRDLLSRGVRPMPMATVTEIKPEKRKNQSIGSP